MEYTIGTKVFGDWKIVAALGEGANGKVFEIHKETKYGGTSKAALKLIRVPQSDAEVRAALAEGMDDLTVTGYFRGVVEEIIKEINIMESLKSSTGIVICEDSDIIEHAGSFGWDILIRMELLTSLQEYQRKHRMEEAEVLHMAQNLCSALMFCQKKGMIHRDIKPGNIFVNEEGDFKLGDFGVARTLERTTGGLSKKGTESYMAPEVYLSKPYGASVDMYSLGLVLYQALNDNRLPFMPPAPQPIRISDRENALNRRVVKGESLPAPRLASPEFAKVILKACAWNPDDRYSTAAEMLEEVNRIVANRLLGTAGLEIAPEEEMTIGSTQTMESAEEVTVGVPDGNRAAAEEATVGAPGGSIAAAAEEATIGSPGGIPEMEEATVGAAGTYAAEDKTVGAAGIYAAEDKTIGAAGAYEAEDKTIGAAAGVNPQKESAEKAAGKAQDAYEAAWESAKQGTDEKNRKKTYILVGAAVAAVAVVIGIYAWMARTFDVTVDGELLGSYKKGAQVTLEADAAPEGQVFAGWTVENGDITLTDASAETTSFTMPAGEVKVAANYEMVEYTAEVESGSGAGTYTMGEIVEISADAAPEGQKFAGWTVENGDITLADASAETTSFTMSAGEVKVAANYEKVEYTAEVENGSGAGTYTMGETVKISADAAPEGQAFAGWTVENGDIALAEASAETTSFTMPAGEVKVAANYEMVEYTAEVENGSGTGSYTMGETVEISADTAPEGQAFAGWTVENGDITLADASAESTTFTMPAGDVRLTAEYTMFLSVYQILMSD